MNTSKTKENTLGKKAAILSLGNLVNTIIAVISMMIITRMLSQFEFAVYKQTFLAFNIVLPFLSLGLSQGLYYFLPTEERRFSGRVLESFIIYIIVGASFSLFILCGGNKILSFYFNNPDIEFLLLWLIPYSVIILLTQCVTTILNILDKLKNFIVINIITSFIITVSLIVAIIISPNAETAVIIMSIAKVLQGLVFIYLIIKALPKDDWKPRISSIKQLLYFSFPIGLTSMLGGITAQMDGLFVSIMSSPEDYAVYAVAAIEVPIIGVVLGSISTAIIPEMRRLVANNHLLESAKLLKTSAKKVASITFPIACFLAFFATEFITIMYSDKYINAVPIFQVYLLYFLARIMFTGPVFVSLGMNKYLLFQSIVSILTNAILTFLFILFIGPIGAAVGTILSGWVIFLTLILPTLSKKLSVPKLSIYPLKTVFKIVFYGVISGIITRPLSNIIYEINIVVNIIFSAFLYFSIYSIFVFTRCKNEYLWIINFVKTKLCK